MSSISSSQPAEIIQYSCLTYVFICNAGSLKRPRCWTSSEIPIRFFHNIFFAHPTRNFSQTCGRQVKTARVLISQPAKAASFTHRVEYRVATSNFDVFEMFASPINAINSIISVESCTESHLIANFENTPGLSSHWTALLESLRPPLWWWRNRRLRIPRRAYSNCA